MKPLRCLENILEGSTTKKIPILKKSVKKRVVKQKVLEKMLNLIRSRQNWLLGL